MLNFKVINAQRVEEIAKDLQIPEWLVEGVIVEYLPCRRFLEDGALVLLDFNLVTVQDFQQIALPYVLLNGVMLIHNTTSSLSKDRMMASKANFPMARASVSAATFVPEGQVSPSYQLFWYKPIDDKDWKTGLNLFTRAIVFEKKDLFQWIVTDEMPASANPSQTRYISKIFSDEQLEGLQKIHDKLYLNNMHYGLLEDDNASIIEKEKLKGIYEYLAVVREKMRQSVIDYHTSAKQHPETRSAYTEATPPALTIFDEVIIQNGAFKIRSYMKPLFFRAAYRAFIRSEHANSIVKISEPFTMAIGEEIEASAECIVLCAMCLEAYMNGFAQDHLPSLWTKETERMETTVKWLLLPGILGKSDCFNKGTQPYQDFTQLVRWRNTYLAHYKHEFEDPGSVENIGTVSKIYTVCNVSNAKKAIDIVRQMITTLNEHLSLPTPGWVWNEGIWLSPARINMKEQTMSYTTDVE